MDNEASGVGRVSAQRRRASAGAAMCPNELALRYDWPSAPCFTAECQAVMEIEIIQSSCVATSLMWHITQVLNERPTDIAMIETVKAASGQMDRNLVPLPGLVVKSTTILAVNGTIPPATALSLDRIG